MFHSKDGFWIEQTPISGAAEIADVTKTTLSTVSAVLRTSRISLGGT